MADGLPLEVEVEFDLDVSVTGGLTKLAIDQRIEASYEVLRVELPSAADEGADKKSR